MKIDDIMNELAKAPIYLEDERDLVLFSDLLNRNIDEIIDRENDFHQIMERLIESFHGNFYFRYKEKLGNQEHKLLRIIDSGKAKNIEDLKYYINEIQFISNNN